MIRCTECKEWKSEKEFPENKKKRSGLKSSCKACNRERARAYRHTKEGLITTIYSNQKQNSRQRKRLPPSYTKKELKDWLFSQELFYKLYEEWRKSDYEKDFSPSCDRKLNHKPYILGNLQLGTWKKNKQRGHDDMRKGIVLHGVNPQKAVIGTHIITGGIIEFHSACEAKRQTGISNKDISACCLKRKNRESAGGYKWRFK